MLRSLRPFGGWLLSACCMLTSLATLSAQSRPYKPMRAATVRQVQAEVDQPEELAPELSAPATPPAVAPSWSPDRPKPMMNAAPRNAPPPGVPAGRSWQTKQQMNSMNAIPRGASVRQAPAELPRPRLAPSPASNRQRAPEPLLAEGDEYGYEQVPPPAGDYAPSGDYAEREAWPDGAPYGHGYGGCGCQGCQSCACGPQCGGGCCDDGCGCVGGHGCAGVLGFGKGMHFPSSLAIFAGVQGFKGGLDEGLNGNFGFHEGLNLGGALFPGVNVGYQVGLAFTQTNLGGATVDRVVGGDALVSTEVDQRNQVFITAGLFHRAVCMGWQGGAVWDLLHDDFFSNLDLHQIRGELSYVGPARNELGVWVAVHSKSDDGVGLFGFTNQWQPLDLYTLFLRKNFDNGANARLWGGCSGDGEGLFGGDLNLPLSCSWGLSANFNYLIPGSDDETQASHEGWNVGISMIWYPGCGFPGGCSPARPLFNVADNGTFMVRRR